MSIQRGLIHKGGSKAWPFLPLQITPDLGLSWTSDGMGEGNTEALSRSIFLGHHEPMGKDPRLVTETPSHIFLIDEGKEPQPVVARPQGGNSNVASASLVQQPFSSGEPRKRLVRTPPRVDGELYSPDAGSSVMRKYPKSATVGTPPGVASPVVTMPTPMGRMSQLRCSMTRVHAVPLSL